MMNYVLKLTRAGDSVPALYQSDSVTTTTDIAKAKVFDSEHEADKERANSPGIWRRKAQIVPVRAVVVTTTKVEEVPE